MRKREETVRADAIAETAAETPGREAFCEKIDRRGLTALPLSPAGSSAPYADFGHPNRRTRLVGKCLFKSPFLRRA
jgi:hypothetical protein